KVIQMANRASDKKPETDVLNLRQGVQPMPDRGPRPATDVLAPPWRLLLQIDGENQTTVGLSLRERTMLGRSDNNRHSTIDLDLTPYGAYQHGVSRHHAAISHHDATVYIEDLGSTNGTRINGFQLSPNQKYRLRDGDEVEIARIRLVMRFVRPS